MHWFVIKMIQTGFLIKHWTFSIHLDNQTRFLLFLFHLIFIVLKFNKGIKISRTISSLNTILNSSAATFWDFCRRTILLSWNLFELYRVKFYLLQWRSREYIEPKWRSTQLEKLQKSYDLSFFSTLFLPLSTYQDKFLCAWLEKGLSLHVKGM